MYAKKFPDHPYTQLIDSYFHAKDQIDFKKRFIDFEAEDLEGNKKTSTEPVGQEGNADKFLGFLVCPMHYEKPSWKTNLVDIDGKYGFWNSYAINNAAGMMILVDVNENIIAVNPTAESLIEILERLD